MSLSLDDTIVAVASPPGGAVRGVIRLSGPGTLSCLRQCFQTATEQCLDEVRVPTRLFGQLRLPPPIGALPSHLYLWPNCRSYTRQVSAELHTLGSPPLLDAALECLCRWGARLAQPGEFTLRAFLAGRLDLTQAEAVLGVIDAADSRELQTALAQLAGGLSGPLHDLRSSLLDLLAHVEAGLDFAEEDIAFITPEQLDGQLAAALAHVRGTLAQLVARGDASQDPGIVLRGWPNVGKSSLFNALVAAEAVIVSPQAGTTRDYVAHPFRWQEVAGVLIDTPGFVDAGSQDTLADAAQELAARQVRQASLTILCLDITRPLNAWERDVLSAKRADDPLVVWTKADLTPAPSREVAGAIVTSSHTGEGLDALRTAVARRLAACGSSAGVAVASTALRCRQSLLLAAEHLRQARQLLAERGGEELVAVELRDALEELGQVVGAVYTEDILDRIFSRFCIGK